MKERKSLSIALSLLVTGYAILILNKKIENLHISIFSLLFSGRMGSSFILPGIDPKQGNRDLITKKTQYSILFFLPIIEELESLSHQLQYSYPQVSCLYSPSILITPGYQNLHNRATPPLLVNWTIVDSESEKTEIGFDSKDTYTDF